MSTSKTKNKKTLSEKEKQLWNKAVAATLRQVNLYDGIITDDGQRKYLCESVAKRMMYKTK